MNGNLPRPELDLRSPQSALQVTMGGDGMSWWGERKSEKARESYVRFGGFPMRWKVCLFTNKSKIILKIVRNTFFWCFLNHDSVLNLYCSLKNNNRIIFFSFFFCFTTAIFWLFLFHTQTHSLSLVRLSTSLLHEEARQ